MHALVAAQAARASLCTPWHYRRLCVLNDKGPSCSSSSHNGGNGDSHSNSHGGNLNEEEAEARAQAPKVTKIERRYDPWTGIPYTLDEFYDYYQQLNEWDSASLAPPLMVPLKQSSNTAAHALSSSSSSSSPSLPNSTTESAAVARAWAVSADGAALGYGATSILRPDPAAGWFGDQGEVTVSAGSFLALRTPPPVPVVAAARHKDLLVNRKQELMKARQDATKAKTAAKAAAKHEKEQQRRAKDIRLHKNKSRGSSKGKGLADGLSSEEDSEGSSEDDEGKEDDESEDDNDDDDEDDQEGESDPFAASLGKSDSGLAEVNIFGPKLATARALHVCLPTAHLPSPHFLVQDDRPSSAESLHSNGGGTLNSMSYSRNSSSGGGGLPGPLHGSPAAPLVPFTAVDVMNRLYLPHCALVTLSRGGVLSDIQHVSQLLPAPPNAPRNSSSSSSNSGGNGQANSGDGGSSSASAHVEGLSFGSGSGQSLEEAFLLCGASAVVSPLWNSSEASLPNALLLLDFYAKLPAASEESPPVPSPVASALRSAQQWLKKASYQDLAAALANDRGLKATTRSSLQRQLKEHMVARMAAETAAPFASPEWWGSFRVIGAGTASTHSLSAPGTVGGKPAPQTSSSTSSLSKKGLSSSSSSSAGKAAAYVEMDPLRWRPRASLEALRTLQQFHGVAGGMHDQTYQAALQDETQFKAFSEELGDLSLGETMAHRWGQWENYRAASQDHEMALAEHKAVLQEATASLAETRAQAARRRAEALQQSQNLPGRGPPTSANGGSSGGGGASGADTGGVGGAASTNAAVSAAAVAAAIEEATAATETAASAAAEARAQRAALTPVKGQTASSSSSPVTHRHYEEHQEQQQEQRQEGGQQQEQPYDYSVEHATYEYSEEHATEGASDYEAAPAAAYFEDDAYATSGAAAAAEVQASAGAPAPPAATAEEEDFWAIMAAEEEARGEV